MGDTARKRRPVKSGYFTVPADPAEAPKLLGTRCDDCGEYFFPKRAVCAKCLSENTAEAEIGPSGTLYSYTFVHFPLFGSTKMEHVGYGVGQVDLPEGPRVQTPLAGKQEDFRVGMPLVAELEPIREDGDTDVVILRFRPAEAGGAR
ncbi:MAG TPA: zinc ribbon domain-containing protein [Candidatus Binatia bacterium]|nr:zinc ribbon domain-containing protein [Candidatus Binatia bacterium]